MEGGGRSEVADVEEAFRGCVEKHGGVARVELAVSNYFVQFFHALRLHVDYVVHFCAVVHMPKVHSQIIRGQKVFAIWRKTQRVDVVLMRTAILSFASAFPSFIYNF